jgi:hypothetical protein
MARVNVDLFTRNTFCSSEKKVRAVRSNTQPLAGRVIDIESTKELCRMYPGKYVSLLPRTGIE